MSASLPRGNFNCLAGRYSEPQDPLLPVVRKKLVPQNLGNFAGGEAPHYVHLPQAVLRSHKSLRKEEIVEIRGLNRGHAVLIPNHGDFGGQTRDLQTTVQLRQGRARDGVGPDQRSQDHQQNTDYKERKGPPAAERLAGSGNGSRGRRHSELLILWCVTT